MMRYEEIDGKVEYISPKEAGKIIVETLDEIDPSAVVLRRIYYLMEQFHLIARTESNENKRQIDSVMKKDWLVRWMGQHKLIAFRRSAESLVFKEINRIIENDTKQAHQKMKALAEDFVLEDDE